MPTISEILKDIKKSGDCDDIRFKDIIKEKLLQNEKIAYVLNNKELQEKKMPVDEYFGVNILPYFLITDTQTKAMNYLCYEVSFDEVARYNEVIKVVNVIFYIICNQKDIIDKNTGVSRQDLLAALILDEFNWTNYFGNQIHCVSDKPSTTDAQFSVRTLVFEMQKVNNIVKTRNKVARVINSEVHV